MWSIGLRVTAVAQMRPGLVAKVQRFERRCDCSSAVSFPAYIVPAVRQRLKDFRNVPPRSTSGCEVCSRLHEDARALLQQWRGNYWVNRVRRLRLRCIREPR